MRLLDHPKRGIKPVRYARVVALAAAIGLHLGIFLLWLPEQPAPGRQYNGSRARLNLRLYPLVEDQPAPQVPPRTTASTGQVAQTRTGQPRSTIDNASASEAAPAVAAQIASPLARPVSEDPLAQSRWRESGSPWQEELEAAARAQIAEKAAAERSPWPYDQPLPALPFDDYGEKPLVMLPPEGEEDEGPTVKFLGMTIGIGATPVLDTPNEVGRWISDNPTTRAMERIQRSECQPAPGDGPDWRKPGWCG